MKAKNVGLKPGKMKKADLIRAIQIQEGNNPCFSPNRESCDQTGCCWHSDCVVA
ncbi:MAG TPA: SAP domain-containing protein [Desulfobacteraceae bacterium]|nr:SAP domain-containing protein [Desulfobacteraceae bacterium]